MGEAARQQDVRLWYNSRQAAEMLGITDASLKSLVFRGRLVPDHRGGQDGLKSHRFMHETLVEFIANRKKREGR